MATILNLGVFRRFLFRKALGDKPKLMFLSRKQNREDISALPSNRAVDESTVVFFVYLLQQQLCFVLFQRLTCGLVSFEAGLRRELREDFHDLVTLAVPDTLE
ncbi:MAG: hypothetical protein ACI9TA_001714 [Reinekea sp.]|jgi:hypothetical protein